MKQHNVFDIVFNQSSPFTISVDGASLQVDRSLKDFQAVVLQNLSACCIVLCPVWHLHGNSHCVDTLKTCCNVACRVVT